MRRSKFNTLAAVSNRELVAKPNTWTRSVLMISTFATGPAGCGKTYLAVAMAVEALRAGSIRKIVLVRPAVEAGESLGFLPGDLRAKLNPYLRPLMDALGEMVDYNQARGLMEADVIEVIPLAYMRGRTLNDAFIILDECRTRLSPR